MLSFSSFCNCADNVSGPGFFQGAPQRPPLTQTHTNDAGIGHANILVPEIAALSLSQEGVGYGRTPPNVQSGCNNGLCCTTDSSSVTLESPIWNVDVSLDTSIPNDRRINRGQLHPPHSGPASGPSPKSRTFPHYSQNNPREDTLGAAGSGLTVPPTQKGFEYSQSSYCPPGRQMVDSSPPFRDPNPEPSTRQSEKYPSANQIWQPERSTRNKFDGPVQYLADPSPEEISNRERNLPNLPTNLDVREQDDILRKVNNQLSQCAFYFFARYKFPIPLESDKRPVSVPDDREWNEWVFLLKGLATKRKIPARLLYNRQIKQLVTILENSLEMRHAAKHQSRPCKDDRNVLQLISAGIQVVKILQDASAMEFLDALYVKTESKILEMKRQ